MPAPYRIVFARGVREHLAVIDSKYHSLIRDTIHEQLIYEPFVETRNRKPVAGMTPFGLVWELRFGPQNIFRVFYSGDADEVRVSVVAIGVKERNVLRVGGEEIEL